MTSIEERSVEPAVLALTPSGAELGEPCTHCGLNVAVADLEPGAEHQFCCSGCRTVFALLAHSGLSAYYEHRGTSTPQSAAQPTGDWAHFDAPQFAAAHIRQDGDCSEMTLVVQGVHCSACVWLLEKLPQLLPSVVSSRLQYSESLLRVRYRTTEVAASKIAQTLDQMGYPPHPFVSGTRAQLLAVETRQLLLRLGVAAASAGSCMLLGLALYTGALTDMAVEYTQYFRWASGVAALPAIVWSAQGFYRGAWAALRTRTAHMDLPIALGIVAASVSGAVHLVRGGGDIYFDSVTLLVFLLLVGRLVLLRQQRRAELSAGTLRALVPHTARRVGEGGERCTVPADALTPGQRVEVYAGELLPVDGVVVEGRSEVEVAWLTGEAMPERVQAGDRVCAGTTNLSGTLLVQAEAVGEKTRAAKLLREVQSVSATKTPLTHLADRLSKYFLLSVLGLCLLAFALHWRHGLEAALEVSIALLVVTCPCALGLATPLAMSAALAQAAKLGWLIKGPSSLEALAKASRIVFDKTGTLTLGQVAVVQWYGDPCLQGAVRALESESNHPVARAVQAAYRAVEPTEVHGLESKLGAGVSGWVAGQLLRVGTQQWTTQRPLAPWAVQAVAASEEQGHSCVFVSVQGTVQAVIALGDRLRPEAESTLRQLLAQGHRLTLLSGDRQSAVRRVSEQLTDSRGRELFDEALGGVGPEAKLLWVRKALRSGPVVMVGDGVNDAGALAAATVGIAVHGGAEASVAAADVFATAQGLGLLSALLAGARRTMSVIRLNLVFSLAYNAVAVGLALTGLISPLVAAVLMPLSSLTVVSHSYRRRMFSGPH